MAVADRILSAPSNLEPRRATLTDALDPSDRRPLDRVLATYFPGPHSYTGEDVVEISGHGSPVILRQIVRAATLAGARLAEPGEFTFRAFLRGRSIWCRRKPFTTSLPRLRRGRPGSPSISWKEPLRR